MKKTHLLTALLCLLSGAASADDGLSRCRKLQDSVQRLACYDALPTGASPAPPAQPAMSVTPPAAREARFGLEAKPPKDELAEVHSHVVGRFEGWTPGSQIRLANGQVWRIDDDSYGLFEYDNPKVTVERGLFGGFLMKMEGISKVARVKRVQ